MTPPLDIYPAVRDFICRVCGEIVKVGDHYGEVDGRLACEPCVETEWELEVIHGDRGSN